MNVLKLLQGMLREERGFKGLDRVGRARSTSLFPELVAYRSDRPLVDLVDTAAWHMLYIECTTGVFDCPLPTMENPNKTLRAPAHPEVNKSASGEAIVLLGNDASSPSPAPSKLLSSVPSPKSSIPARMQRSQSLTPA